jgi:hypothetical protein
MPWPVLLARSRVYGPFRIGGAPVTGIAAAAWLGERAVGWVNPVVPVVESVMTHALWLLAGLVVVARRDRRGRGLGQEVDRHVRGPGPAREANTTEVPITSEATGPMIIRISPHIHQ